MHKRDSLKTLEELISYLFKNGWGMRIGRAQRIYGEHGEKLLNKLNAILPRYAIRNFTDWTYSTCFIFDILLHPDVELPTLSRKRMFELITKLGGSTYSLWFEIAATLDFFTYGFRCNKLDVANNELLMSVRKTPFNERQKEIFEKIERFLNHEGFLCLPDEFLSVKIRGISGLDLYENQEITLNQCLFGESINVSVERTEILKGELEMLADRALNSFSH